MAMGRAYVWKTFRTVNASVNMTGKEFITFKHNDFMKKLSWIEDIRKREKIK